MDEMKVLITFANCYDMTKDGGNVGMTLNYFFWGEHGELLVSQNDLSGAAVGYQRAKCSVDTKLRDKISFVPGVYKVRMGMKVGSDGKPVLTVTDIGDFLGKVEIKMAVPSGK